MRLITNAPTTENRTSPMIAPMANPTTTIARRLAVRDAVAILFTDAGAETAS
jgi:hypothetical protein